MSKRLGKLSLVLVVLVIAAQLVRPGRVNPPGDPSHSIQATLGATNALSPVLDRACGDCHSNVTDWSPWYARVAPLSWLMVRGVAEGRKALNFSEWAGYPPEVQRKLLVASCEDATSGKMPGLYTLFRPEAKLSPEDVATICAAGGQR